MDQAAKQAGEALTPLLYRAREEAADVRSTGFSRNPDEEPPKGGTVNSAFLAAGGIEQTVSPARTRRQFLQAGAGGLACLAGCGLAVYYWQRRSRSLITAEIFKGDAPQGDLWEAWQRRGWVREAREYLKLGRNVQCKLCPNECLLGPEDRSHCRNRVNKDGVLYTLAYGNAASFHVDPIEKKPLFHFLPGSEAFSFAAGGCGFRCLNCQNWDISQRKPEELKDPRGEPVRLRPENLDQWTREDIDRLSLMPQDAVALAGHFGSTSIAYTYSEPIAWYEYVFDTAELAREKNVKNVWGTCGYIQEKPLVELCRVIDAASVNLKSFSDEVYRELNSGTLAPVLATLKTLKREGVWTEVINLIVPTYTDKPELIRPMCEWLVENLGPDCPLHFSRFHPAHKLTNLPPTPVEVLLEVRDIARQSGLHYVYIGNVRGVEQSETTFCPGCKRPVVERDLFSIATMDIVGGNCKSCGTKIAGVWS
ncbi:MAG: AmmeMemoRadiSam system radical SAM enzyme [Thermoguttaceae bacterium]